MIRKSALALMMMLGSLVAMPTMAAIITASASLDALQEVPPNPSTATGSATFTIDDVTGDYTFDLEVIGIDVFEINAAVAGGIHIHEAPIGFNGGIVVNVSEDRTSLTMPGFEEFIFKAAGVVVDIEGVVNALTAGDLYVNVHTEEYPGGEIRGQLAVVPLPAGVWLFGSAIIGLVGISRRRRA